MTIWEETILKSDKLFGGVLLKKEQSSYNSFFMGSPTKTYLNQWLITNDKEIERFGEKKYFLGLSIICNFETDQKGVSRVTSRGDLDAPFSVSKIIFNNPTHVLEGKRTDPKWSDYEVVQVLLDYADLEDVLYLIENFNNRNFNIERKFANKLQEEK